MNDIVHGRVQSCGSSIVTEYCRVSGAVRVKRSVSRIVALWKSAEARGAGMLASGRHVRGGKGSATRPFRFAESLLLATWVVIGHGADAVTVSVSAPPSLEWAANRIRNVDPRPLGEALARAGLEYPHNVHVTLASEDDPPASAWPRWIVGVAEPPADILVFPVRTTRYPYDSLESVLRHEVAHLALTQRARGRPLPRWFHEGVAVSIEAGFGFGDEARLFTSMVSRPGIGDVGRLFASGTEADSSRAYLLATALVVDVRRRHGPEVVGAIADGVGQDLSFDQAFAKATGETVAEATAAAWAGYLRWTRWILALDRLVSTWTLVLVVAAVAFVVQRRRRARRRKQWEDEAAADASDDVDDTGTLSGRGSVDSPALELYILTQSTGASGGERQLSSVSEPTAVFQPLARQTSFGGRDHNALVQESNPVLHGEMAALRSAGRMRNRHNTTMYTTLQPCFMCSGAIVQFGIPRVVIGDAANTSSDETIRFMRDRGIEVIVLDPDDSSAARASIELVRRFREQRSGKEQGASAVLCRYEQASRDTEDGGGGRSDQQP